MARIEFGQLVPCRTCKGAGSTGKGNAMDPAERRARARELRQAKRAGIEPPPIVRGKCHACGGAGYV